MAIYVYITEQCKKDIERQQYTATINAFKSKIEKAQLSDVFDRFPPPFLKKRFERQVRLVAKECLLGEHTVVAFLRLLVRGGSEYAAFGATGWKSLPGFERMADELNDDVLTRYVESRKEPMPPPPPSPTDEESAYLHSALSLSENIYHDYHCCETRLWVDTILNEEFANRLLHFVEPVFGTIDSKDTGLAEARCRQDKRFGILYRRIPEHKMVILFAPFKDTPPVEQVKSLYAELLTDGPFQMESALKKSKRAYPHELLLNEDAWFRVQKDKDVNMALSLEEIEVLESARVNEGGYPLFINGRAGSGKSTILQYLFSEYLYHHLESAKTTPGPVLFACNDELLARSSNSVRSLLQIRYGKRDQNNQPFEKWISQYDPTVRQAFRNFHSWLQKLAPRDAFPNEKLIDYGRFKQWWENRFSKQPSARRLFDAGISWHVIRTYIKGISAEGYLDPEDYLEIPARQKSVTPETYQVVFDTVWKRYHQDQKELGLWDHQDIARYVLDRDLIKHEHPVVFCDEAQDFTRIELEILHRHCIFNARTIKAHDLSRIPLAFAGDPFQTLNPTGFRWEATKAFFAEKFLTSYPGQKKGELNYRELTYNYRSSRHIVRFCNSLQLVRRVVFDFPEIKPQHPWEDDEDAPSVSYYERGDLEVLNTLKDQSEIRIIVPCEEGGEAEWVRQNGLADFVEFDEADVPKNVVSPTRVKGLEFARVVLFGFGGACPPALRKAISESGSPLKGDTAIEPQYFLNRLYVAASRPRKRLFIIDSAGDIQGFWNQIFSNQETFTLRTHNVADWEGKSGQLLKGSPETWEGDKEDPLETAEKLAKEGRLRRDRILLRQAAQSYDNAKKPIFAKKCRGEALELEGKYLEAAGIWQEIQEFDRSVAAAWRCGESGYEFILELASAHPDLKNRIHYKFAYYIKSNGGLSDGVALLKDLEQSMEDDELREEVLTNSIWTEATRVCLERMQATKTQETGLWKLAYSCAVALSKVGVRIPNEILGDVAFRSDLMREAYKYWEEVPTERRSRFERNFLHAKAMSMDFPQSLEVFGELLGRHRNRKDAEDILNLVQQEGVDKLKSNHRETIARAHFVVGELERVYTAVNDISDMQFLFDILEAVVSTKSTDHVGAILSRIAELLANQDRWPDFVGLLENGFLREFKSEQFKRWADSHPYQHVRPFIEFLAMDGRIEGGARNDLKTNLANFLRSRFGSSFAWRHEVHPLLVGRAFELAGLFKETLPYYESMAASNLLSDETRRMAWQRWARTKGLQAAREREMNATGRAEKLYKEAMDKAISLRFHTPEAIPAELPSPLPPVDSELTLEPHADSRQATAAPVAEVSANTATKTSSTAKFSRKLDIGPLEIRVSPDGRRINILHLETFSQASLHLPEKIAKTEDGSLAPDDKNRIFINTWNLEVGLSELALGKVLLRTDDDVEILLPVAVEELPIA